MTTIIVGSNEDGHRWWILTIVAMTGLDDDDGHN